MKRYIINKNSEGYWSLILDPDNDETRGEYRFNTKRELNAWLKRAELK